jgi:hypothetical protein
VGEPVKGKDKSMEVQIVSIRRNDDGKVEYIPQCQISSAGEDATLEEYINKKTGKPDPIIRYASNRFVHMSTVYHQGRRVMNKATGELVEVENLSEW